jgi:hypothetical protein
MTQRTSNTATIHRMIIHRQSDVDPEVIFWLPICLAASLAEGG